MKYKLYYDGYYHSTHESVVGAYFSVQNDYRAFLKDREQYSFQDEFSWNLYALYQVVDVDFELFVTTNKRGSIPQSHRGEGNNDIG